MRRYLMLICIVIALVVIGGCDWLSNFPRTDGPSLAGTAWQLESVRSVSGDSVLFAPGDDAEGRGFRYSVRFGDEGRLHGYNACNTCTGWYEEGSNRSLSIGMSCTEMGCGRGAFLSYAPLMGQVTHYRRQGERLLLFGTTRDSQRVVLSHRATATLPLPARFVGRYAGYGYVRSDSLGTVRSDSLTFHVGRDGLVFGRLLKEDTSLAARGQVEVLSEVRGPVAVSMSATRGDYREAVRGTLAVRSGTVRGEGNWSACPIRGYAPCEITRWTATKHGPGFP